nr:winged helix-turn-helix domain-containing protein [Micromonospora tarapacensis]
MPVSEPVARPAADQSIPHPQFEIPILRALEQLGGGARAHEVIERVGQLLAAQLTDADRQKLGNGQTRWRLRCNVARNDLIKRGHLSADSARGRWEITDQGLERLHSVDGVDGVDGVDQASAPVRQQGADSAPATARSSFASRATNEAPAPPVAGPSSEAGARRSTTRRG